MFQVSKEQDKQISEWMHKKRKDGKPEGAIGGRFTFNFTPTSLGVVITVKDNILKDFIDVTDYDSW